MNYNAFIIVKTDHHSSQDVLTQQVSITHFLLNCDKESYQ